MTPTERPRRTPVLLQAELAECGIACLAMAAAAWGRCDGLAALRQALAPSSKGSTLATLVAGAQALGFDARARRCAAEALHRLVLPCVLHWEHHHYVVLVTLGPRGAVVHDPAAGRRRFTLPELARHYSGVALEMRPGAAFEPRPAPPRLPLRRLLGPLSGLRRGMGRALGLALALQACALAGPLLLQRVVDQGLVQADRPAIAMIGGGLLLLALLRSGLGALRSCTLAALAARLNTQWLDHAFGHLMALPLPFFERRHLGDIVSRFQSIQAIQHGITTQAVEALVDGLLAAAALLLMARYSLPLTALAVAAAGAVAALRALAFGVAREAAVEQIVHGARQQAHLMESVRGVAALRLHGRTDARRSAWLQHLAGQLGAGLRSAWLGAAVRALQDLAGGTARAGVVVLAAGAVLDGRLSAGMMFAFIACHEHFAAAVAALVDKAFELRMLGLHADRVADLLQAAPEPAAPAGAPLGPLSLELRDLGFRYAPGEPFVLRHLDLRIDAGESVAVTGPSGCGKTTLVKLLLGLLEPTEGEILVNGRPLADVGLARYRAAVAAVLQDDLLFTGSIAENIAFFDPRADAARITACAREAALADEIEAMPMRWRTLVAEGGAGLSGGQRQRLLLARTLYRAPQLLVLDEATSHLDLANEQRVNAQVAARRITRVLMAHRPQTLAAAERVVELAAGRVVRDLRRTGAPRAGGQGISGGSITHTAGGVAPGA